MLHVLNIITWSLSGISTERLIIMGSIYNFFCCVLLLCFCIFQLIWECLLPLGYFVVTPLPVCAVLGYDRSIIRRDDSILSQSISSGAAVAWRWLLIGLLGYYVVASLSHSTDTLCFEQFVIVELWLLIWPFQASLIPAARDVLRSSCFRLKRGLLLFVILSACIRTSNHTIWGFFGLTVNWQYILICGDFASPAIKLSSVHLLFWSPVVIQSIVGLPSAFLWRDTPGDSWNRLHSLGL